jgi:hypothetical protein
MAKFIVTIERTERIGFEVEATDRFDAEERYMMDGDEVWSDTTNIDVLSTIPKDNP